MKLKLLLPCCTSMAECCSPSKARKYVCEKLGIPQQKININFSLKRPVFAKKDFNVDRIDEATFYWGTEGITLGFLKKIVSCICMNQEAVHNRIFKNLQEMMDQVEKAYLFIEQSKFKQLCACK